MQRFASILFLPLFCLSLTVLPLPAQSANAKGPDVASIKPLQDWQKKTNTQINYIGSRYGMDVWIATRDSVLQLIYTTPDKQAMLINGILVGPDGTDVTTALQQEFVSKNPEQAEAMLQVVSGDQKNLSQVEPSAQTPQPGTSTQVAAQKPSKSELLWRDLADAHSVTIGPKDGVPTAYMFVDLGCSHCKDLWAKVAPAVNAKLLQVKLVPVSVLGPDSEKAAAALLGMDAAQQVKAWDNHIKGGKDATNFTQAGKAALTANQQLFAHYKQNSTPILVYRSQAEQKVKMVLGTPADMNGIWADIGIQNPGEIAKTN